MKNYLSNVFFSVTNAKEFTRGLQQVVDSIPKNGIFIADNLITFPKNLSFLDDATFMGAFTTNAKTEIEKGIIWRTHVLSWAADIGLRLDGDFVECGCYKGVSAKIVCDYLDFKNSGKTFYLYDLFEHSSDMDHEALPEHGPELYQQVKDRFRDYHNVRITQGPVPAIFSESPPPAKIAFLHIDMNEVGAEMGALDLLFERLTPGAFLVLDDYGWIGYVDQKIAQDRFFAERNYKVLELPTGQGLVVK